MSQNSLRRFIGRFEGAPILVVGDLMLDEYLWGTVSRISPEAPIPIVDVQRVTYSPGGAANVAANIVALGGRPLLVGIVGADEAAERLRRELVRRGIPIEGLLTEPQRPTTVKSRVVAHSQQVVRVDREQRQPLAPALARKLLQGARRALVQAAVVLISDYAKGVVVPQLVRGLVSAVQGTAKPIIIDPKGLDYRKYRGATLITPNLQEAGRAAHMEIGNHADLQRAGQRLLELIGPEALLITCGEEGMWLFQRGNAVCHLKAVAREVYDVTGAGDTVAGTLALALAAGADFQEAAQLASCAAGIAVEKVGTATLTPSELAQALERLP